MKIETTTGLTSQEIVLVMKDLTDNFEVLGPIQYGTQFLCGGVGVVYVSSKGEPRLVLPTKVGEDSQLGKNLRFAFKAALRFPIESARLGWAAETLQAEMKGLSREAASALSERLAKEYRVDARALRDEVRSLLKPKWPYLSGDEILEPRSATCQWCLGVTGKACCDMECPEAIDTLRDTRKEENR